MRILADENFPRPLVVWLRDLGHDVLWAATDLQRWLDPKILELAEVQGRVLFTVDKDFEQLARQRRTPLRWSGVVMFRIHPNFADTLKPFVHGIVAASTDWRGHVTIVTVTGIKMIPLQ